MREYKEDEVCFTINEIAKRIGVVPATIRNWEKAGLFTAKRSENGYRIFTFSDIEYLENIKRCSKDKGMGISAIRLLYGNDRDNLLQKKDDVTVSRKLLSKKWKDYRLKRGESLEDVARAIGISASYLSRIENQQTVNVSLEILQRLADFYGENLLYYVNEAEQNRNLVKRKKGEKFTIGIPGISIESVTAMKSGTLSVMIYTVGPGSGRDSASSHSGEEFVYLLSGQLEFHLEEEIFFLSPGDSLSYSSLKSHYWHNNGKKIAKILWVYPPEVREEQA